MNSDQRHALRRLLQDRRKATPGHPIGAIIGGWRFAISPASDNQGVHLSASLYPMGRSSTDDDWYFIGEATAVLGAPDDALLTPFDTTHPNAVHHWQWGVSRDARAATLDVLPAVKEAVRSYVTRKQGGGDVH